MSIDAAHENHHDINTDINNNNDNENNNNGELTVVQIIETILNDNGTHNINPNSNPNFNWDTVHRTHEFKLAMSEPHMNMNTNTTATLASPTVDGGNKLPESLRRLIAISISSALDVVGPKFEDKRSTM